MENKGWKSDIECGRGLRIGEMGNTENQEKRRERPVQRVVQMDRLTEARNENLGSTQRDKSMIT